MTSTVISNNYFQHRAKEEEEGDPIQLNNAKCSICRHYIIHPDREDICKQKR
jgi:hypothetical protein